ncbi:sigma-70 family RNA polymerase sigma factor [Kiloniella sp. b19]|uniref:sigma-70 family RNA polymerase sigma factor n=1 Tax=Kiloniella sp. GXU_MW_B19 TaxID=3141326 RepID=UPI0031DB7EED
MLLNNILTESSAAMPDVETPRADYASDIQAVAASRDPQAFKRLFDYFGPRLKAYLMKSGSDASQAEEVMQEAMVALWRKAHLFDPAKARPSTWIFTIARNLRIDVLRKQARQVADWNDPSAQPDPVVMSDTVVELKENRVRIKEALKDLSKEQMEVIHLCFFRDLSHSQIADALGIPLGTVKSRIRLAVGKLKTALENA